MPYILALDQGTTSSRAIVFDHDGAIAASRRRSSRRSFPKPGWVEHDPQEIWASQIGVAVEALGRAGLRAARHRRHRHHQPARDDDRLGPRDRRAVYNAIVWQDRRTADFCERLKADGAGPIVQQKTGLLIDAYFSGTQDPLDSRQRAGRARARPTRASSRSAPSTSG